MSLLTAESLAYQTDKNTLVQDASFTLEPGTLTALVGPNGAGKTTLLRLALGLLKPDAGSAMIEGADIAGLGPVERARKIAYLPQSRPLVWPQPVHDVVALGRYAYGATPDRRSPQDKVAIARAIKACGLEGLEERAADTLSGGELSRVHVARALAAQTPVLIADEPVAALDPRYAHEVLRLFRLGAQEGRAVLTVLHDLQLAARYADRLIWMKDGIILADGSPQETLTVERMRSVFGVEARVENAAGTPISLDILGPAQAL